MIEFCFTDKEGVESVLCGVEVGLISVWLAGITIDV